MAYDHTQYEVSLGNDVVTTSTGEKGDWAPTYMRHRLRAVAVGVTVASATTTAAVVTLYKNTLGTVTTTNRTTIDTITVPGATAAGQVLYVDGLQTDIAPGEELQAIVTTASTTTGTVMINAMVEANWEIPGNNTSMTESA